MKKIIFTLSILVFFLFMLQVCFPTLEISPQDVEEKINAALKSGDSAVEIEEYLASQKLVSSYDKYNNRYQGIIRHPNSNFHAITFKIYLNKDKAFIRVEANDSYTFL